MKNFVVVTRDVDGSSRRRFASFAGARKYFESMLGLTMEQALADMFFDRDVPPAAEAVRIVRGVSMFGTVVVFERVSPELDRQNFTLC